jgi:hypothetical protein
VAAFLPAASIIFFPKIGIYRKTLHRDAIRGENFPNFANFAKNETLKDAMLAILCGRKQLDTF